MFFHNTNSFPNAIIYKILILLVITFMFEFNALCTHGKLTFHKYSAQ